MSLDQQRVDQDLDGLNCDHCTTQHLTTMAEESTPTASVLPASSSIDIDTSQAAVDSKQGDATTSEHKSAEANEGTEQQEIEGQSICCLASITL